MPRHGKRHRSAAKNVDPDEKYELKEALGLATAVRCEKFDESLDIAVRMRVDPRKADQNVRGSVVLPKGTGKKFRVQFLLKAKKRKKREMQVRNLLGVMIWAQRFRAGGWSLTVSLLRLT